MKFAVTVAQYADGEIETLVGAELAPEAHIKNLQKLAEENGAGDTRVCVLFSNGAKKTAALNVQKPGARKKYTRKTE